MAAQYINFSGNLSFSGTVAVEDGDSPGGGDGDWWPEGSTAHADFAGGRYYNGEVTTVDSILVENTEVGSFSVDDITPDVGLEDSQPVFAPALTTTMLTEGFTLVATFTQGATTTFSFADPPAWNLAGMIVQMTAGQPLNTNIQTDGGTTDIVPVLNAGDHRIAFSFDPSVSKIAFSANGDAVLFSSAEAPVDPGYNTVGMSTDGVIQSVTIYPLMDDAALPALSAV